MRVCVTENGKGGSVWVLSRSHLLDPISGHFRPSWHKVTWQLVGTRDRGRVQNSLRAQITKSHLNGKSWLRSDLPIPCLLQVLTISSLKVSDSQKAQGVVKQGNCSLLLSESGPCLLLSHFID